jgi:superfamily II DNA or RNA helicase
MRSVAAIWYTTGSGKTLTSFKAARLATDLDCIDKVFFVVDRKDLDYQTMKEYQRFSPDSVNGSDSTAGLKSNLDKDDNKIVVTTIQKLNNLIKSESDLAIYNKQVVFIFDECHRSQFGEAQKNLKKKFKKYYQFGFTGTPIFPENALGAETTGSVFGQQLHTYVITDAIRDEKVLKFKVDYNDVRPQFKSIETEQDDKKLSAAENKKAFLHPMRIGEISQYILSHFNQKTHRAYSGAKGFNAMFAVSSVDAAKAYYETFKTLQAEAENGPTSKPLRIATIFSFAANEEQDAIGDILDESFEVSAMNSSAKEFLSAAIKDYNAMFKSNYGVDSNGFQNYYRDLAQRVKNQEIDLLIVVGMFLTGFDAPTLNTLFVDKNLRYHGLMQAFSRTNRIYDATKTFGNIVTFRDLEQATIDAITLFGDKNTKNVVLEKSYKEYMEGFNDIATGQARRGFVDIVKELQERFPNPENIEKEQDKKEFAKLFGEYLKAENILQNYDEFAGLKALQSLDTSDEQAVEEFKSKYYLDDADIEAMQTIDMPSERAIQDYRSTYNDTRDWTLFQHFRFGRHQLEYRFPVADGTYRIELYFTEPWHGTGGSASTDCEGLRIFDVAVNDSVVLDDLDIWAESGHDGVCKKVVYATVKGGMLKIHFPEVKAGQALISGIAIASTDQELKPTVFPASGWSWEKADKEVMEKTPKELLPEDKNARVSISYEAEMAVLKGKFQKKEHRKQIGVFFGKGKGNSIEWNVSTGLAQVYALRFKYMNTTGKPIPVLMKFIDSKGVVLKEDVLNLPETPDKWKMMSTTTGTFINAGHYKVLLSAENMDGIAFDALDIQ